MKAAPHPDQLALFEALEPPAKHPVPLAVVAAARLFVPPAPARYHPLLDVPPRLREHATVAQANALADALVERLGDSLVRLTLGDSRRNLVSFRELSSRPRQLAVRLHVRFLAAPPAVLDAVARFLLAPSAERRDAAAALRDLVDEQIPSPPLPPQLAREPRIVRRGLHHDLGAILTKVREAYFPGLDARISWGEATANHRLRSLRLGTWHAHQRLVRIHPRLDADWVPAWVLEVIVHHELAHAAAPPRPGRRRRHVHHREFRALEASHPRYAEAQVWIDQHLARLLRRGANRGPKALRR